jgi:hypothetical protein
VSLANWVDLLVLAQNINFVFAYAITIPTS